MDDPKNLKTKTKSGALKRKLKKQKEAELKKIPKLDLFLRKSADSQASTSTVRVENNNEIILRSQDDEFDDVKLVNICEEKNCNVLKEVPNDDHDIIQTDTDKLNVSTDLGKYLNQNISDETKRILINLSPHRPKGPFPKDPEQENRCFSETYYYSRAKYGPVPRLWLCYSTVLDAAYCEPCWLFSNIKGQWRSGIRDWRNLSSRINAHSGSQQHIGACAVYEMWRKNETIDKNAEGQIRYEASFWKMVLERLIRITLMLAKNSLSFRGHREGFSDDYNGNFLSQVQLLAHYDDVMKQIIDMPSGSIRYVSPTIQNELIQCLGGKLLKELILKINAAPFYTLMLDTTQDITKIDQLSIIIRHVHILRSTNQIPINFEIIETFLGFYELKDHSAEGMTDQVMKILMEMNIPIEKCYGQGYDGASVMSGVYNGVQTRIKRIQPNAEYVHCANHNLNLVINDCVSDCHAVSLYFSTLQNIYAFFGNSIKRWDLLSQFSGEPEITLKKLNPTRWSGRIQSLAAVKVRFVDILKALTEISLKSKKKEERDEAIQIQKKMETFDFVFMSIFLYKVMCEINYASKTLQKKDIDLDEASLVLNRVSENIQDFRKSYEQLKLEAVEQAKKWKIDTNFQPKRQPRIRRHFDELASDYRFDNKEQLFKVEVFYFVLDKINAQIKQRFIGMQTIVKNFGFLEPKNIVNLPEADILKLCSNFEKKYPEVITSEFHIQFLHAICLIRQELNEKMTIKTFLKLLLTKYNCLESEFSEIYTAFMLFLTLPVTVAGVERSFSKLKIIKEHKRNSIGQSRLRNLAILSIEHKEAAKMNYADLINEFANLKARKKNF